MLENRSNILFLEYTIDSFFDFEFCLRMKIEWISLFSRLPASMYTGGAAALHLPCQPTFSRGLARTWLALVVADFHIEFSPIFEDKPAIVLKLKNVRILCLFKIYFLKNDQKSQIWAPQSIFYISLDCPGRKSSSLDNSWLIFVELLRRQITGRWADGSAARVNL